MPDKSIVTRLRGVTAVTTLVGKHGGVPNIRAGKLAQGDALPAIAVVLDDSRTSNHAGGASATKFADVLVHCRAATYAAARVLADAAEAALGGWTNTGGTPSISMVHVQSVSYDPGPAMEGQDALREQFTLDCLVQYGSNS